MLVLLQVVMLIGSAVDDDVGSTVGDDVESAVGDDVASALGDVGSARKMMLFRPYSTMQSWLVTSKTYMFNCVKT